MPSRKASRQKDCVRDNRRHVSMFCKREVHARYARPPCMHASNQKDCVRDRGGTRRCWVNREVFARYAQPLQDASRQKDFASEITIGGTCGRLRVAYSGLPGCACLHRACKRASWSRQSNYACKHTYAHTQSSETQSTHASTNNKEGQIRETEANTQHVNNQSTHASTYHETGQHGETYRDTRRARMHARTYNETGQHRETQRYTHSTHASSYNETGQHSETHRDTRRQHASSYNETGQHRETHRDTRTEHACMHARTYNEARQLRSIGVDCHEVCDGIPVHEQSHAEHYTHHGRTKWHAAAEHERHRHLHVCVCVCVCVRAQ
eukprot:1161205-Pelagomonas_calceolata.AAC.3